MTLRAIFGLGGSKRIRARPVVNAVSPPSTSQLLIEGGTDALLIEGSVDALLLQV